jgi:hypothetical protein
MYGDNLNPPCVELELPRFDVIVVFIFRRGHGQYRALHVGFVHAVLGIEWS